MVAWRPTAAQTLLQDQDVLAMFLQTHRVRFHILGDNTNTQCVVMLIRQQRAVALLCRRDGSLTLRILL